MAIYVVDGLTNRRVGLYREYGAEDLLAHHREPIVGLDDQHRRQLALTRCAAFVCRGKLDHSHASGSRFLDVLQDTSVMTLIDHAGVIRVAFEVRIHLADCLTGETDELLAHCCWHEDVIRRDAGLPSIHEFAVQNALDGGWQRGVLTDDAG